MVNNFQHGLQSAGLSAATSALKTTSADRHLSYLPLGKVGFGYSYVLLDMKYNNRDTSLFIFWKTAQIFERIVVITMMFKGASIAFYRGDVSKVLDDAHAAQPTIFTV